MIVHQERPAKKPKLVRAVADQAAVPHATRRSTRRSTQLQRSAQAKPLPSIMAELDVQPLPGAAMLQQQQQQARPAATTQLLPWSAQADPLPMAQHAPGPALDLQLLDEDIAQKVQRRLLRHRRKQQAGRPAQVADRCEQD